MPIYKMRSLRGRLYKPVRGTSSFTPVGSQRVIIDLTEDDSEDDIVRITQVSSRQSAGARLTRQLLAVVKQERAEDDVNGDIEERSGSADSEMGHGYVPVEGCLRAQLEALVLQLQQPPTVEGQQGTPPVKTIRLTGSEAMRKKWGENGNTNDFLILRVQAKRRTASYEVAALRKHLTAVSEVYGDTQTEVRRLQRRLSKQLEDAALRMEIAKTAREIEEADRIHKMEEARKAKQLKQETAQELREAQEPQEAQDRVKELEASKAKQPNQEQPVENKRAKKF